MAQVARASVQAAGGDPRSLKRLSVQFRGMGIPEQEITVTGTVREERDGRIVVGRRGRTRATTASSGTPRPSSSPRAEVR